MDSWPDEKDLCAGRHKEPGWSLEGLETPSVRTGSDSEGNGLKGRRCGKEARNAWTGGEDRRLG